MDEGRVSVIIPGRCEDYFQQTIDSALERATGDIEVVAVIDGYEPDPPLVARDERVKLIHLNKSIGQRAAYNLGVRESSGQFVMKIDAHALLSPGYDEVLKSYCPPMATVLPEMRRLDVHKWKDKPRGRTHFMFFGLDLYCHFWSDYRKRASAKAEYPEVMTGQGSCWFCRREWNDWIGLLDEAVGSWGNVGIEVSLRTWLCGGVQILNRNAWQAHWFRRDEGGFPYPMNGRDVGRAHRYTKTNYYFKDDAFGHQTRPFRWLIEHFAPVPGWEAYLVDQFESPRVIVYYTDSQLEPQLANAVRKRIENVRGQIPVISVSQQPLRFGQNIVVGEKPKAYRSMYEQLLAGLEAAPEGSICYLCEHDVFYHPSHFAFLPPDREHAWFNTNRYHYRLGVPGFLPARDKRALSQCVAYREVLIEHCRQRLDLWGKGIEHRMKIPLRTFASDRPNVDIRHGDNLTRDSDYKREYYRGRSDKMVVNLPGWGSPPHFQKKTGYREFMRWDVVKALVERYDYHSYLEIGTKKGETYNKVDVPVKHGVDPAGGVATHPVTSDEFFRDLPGDALYDVIFIDGLHEAEQARRDIANALAHLSPGGSIVMHDCSPRNREEQTVPRVQGIWTGDVWKAYVHYRRRPDLAMYVVDTNNGVGVIRWGQQEPLVVDDPTWEQFKRHRKTWLNLKTVAEFREGRV